MADCAICEHCIYEDSSSGHNLVWCELDKPEWYDGGSDGLKVCSEYVGLD